MGKIYQLRRQDLIDLLEAEVKLKAIHEASASMYASYEKLTQKAIEEEALKRLLSYPYIEKD